MKRVEKTREKLRDLELRHARQRERETQRLVAIQEKIDAKRAQSDEIEKSSAKNKVEQLKKIGAELEKLERQYESLDKSSKASEVQRLGEIDKATKALKRQESQVGMLGKAFEKISKIKFALGGGAAIGAVIGAYSKAANALQDLSNRAGDIGLTASQLLEFENRAKAAGIESSVLSTSVKAFTRNMSLAAMGMGEAKIALADMGISLTKSNGEYKTQAELLKECAVYFSENAGAAKSAGQAARLFGESGVEVLRVFENGKEDVEKIFDAHSIDEAAYAASKFASQIKSIAGEVKKWTLKGFGTSIMGFGEMFSDLWNLDFGGSSYRRAEEMMNAETKRQNAIRKEAEEGRKKMLAQLREAEAEYEKILKGELSNTERLRELNSEIVELKAKAQKTDDYALLIEYQKEINKLEKERVRLRKDLQNEEARAQAELAKQQEEALKKRQKAELDAIKERIDSEENALKKLEQQRDEYVNRMKQQTESREEFELQSKIDILEAKGLKQEAEKLKFAVKRNELMEKYGYSLEQATKIQSTLDAAANAGKAEYSDEAKARAKRILDRGEGGTVGKRTLEEARAIMEGREVEGGFKSLVFERFKPKEKGAGPKLKDINIDSKSSLESLNKDAKGIEERNAKDAANQEKILRDIADLLQSIKNNTAKVATKKSA